MNQLPTQIKSAIEIAKHTSYLNKNYRYLKNVSITEWDIKSAGLSVLKFRKVLSEDKLKEFESLDKHTRTVREGLLQKNHPEVAEIIIDTLSKVRQGFVLLNHIEDDQILTIKKDAIFLINKEPEINIIKDYFEFRKKNSYTSYILFDDKKEFYYDYLTDRLDVKGLNKEAVEKQQNYFLKDIKSILRSSEKVSADMMFSRLKSYREKYLNRELPLETYRELESGKFRMGKYLFNNISEDMRYEIDISQNYVNYIIPLINMMI